MGFSSLMVALFGIECALLATFYSSYINILDNDIRKILEPMEELRSFISGLYVIMIFVVIMGLRKILYNSYRQKRSSVIVSAIDDTLERAKQIHGMDALVCEQQNNENKDI